MDELIDVTADVVEFNKIVRVLLRRLESKATSESDSALVDNLKRKFRFICSSDEDETLIAQAAPIFVQFSDEINAGDDKFFLQSNPQVFISNTPYSVDKIAAELTNCIKKHYRAGTQAEKTKMIETVQDMLRLCARFLLATTN